MFEKIKKVMVWMVLGVWMAVLLQACGGGGSSATSSGTSAPSPVPAINNINGSATASGSVGSTFIVYGSGFGTLATASPAAGYSVNFLNASGVVAATASWAAGGWNSTYIKATVPTGLTSGTTYNVAVTTPGGTSNKVSFLITGSVAFSPSTISWAQTASMPVATAGFATIVAPVSGVTAVLTLGGNLSASGGAASNNAATVNLNTVNDGTGGTTAGTLNTWSTTTQLPAARGFAAGALANGYNSGVTGYGVVYVIGGLDGTGAATSTVYHATLSADGTIPASGTTGTWAATTALPAARYATGAAIFQGRLYVAGGADNTNTPTGTVWSAPINADGTLGTWATMPALPAALAYHQLITTGGVLYVLGGTITANVNPTSNAQSNGSSNAVYYNPINPADGSLAATWTVNSSSLIKVVEKNTAVAVGSYALVSGGLYNGATNGSTEEQYSSQSLNTLGAFTGATGSKTISGTAGGYNFYNQSVSLYVDPTGKPHVLILGGGDFGTGLLHKGVWYMP